MSSPVNVTESRKTPVLTARTNSGSGGSKPNMPFPFAPGSARRCRKHCGDPALGKAWTDSAVLIYLPDYLFQWLLLVLTGTFCSNCSVNWPSVILIRKGTLLIFSSFPALNLGLFSSCVVSQSVWITKGSGEGSMTHSLVGIAGGGTRVRLDAFLTVTS